jgi:hypothetical protein
MSIALTVNDPAHRVVLHEPRLDGQEVAFRWDVTPWTELYRRTSFRLTFPQQLDLRLVPMALWWRMALLCLHAHFALLRPCVVELPVRLGRGERVFWRRLIETVATQLEAYGDAPRPGAVVELRDSGPRLPPSPLPVADGGAVVAFSGGKDSTVLAAIAAELSERPLLVSVTSPVPWARDHLGAARDRARAEIAQRLPVEAIEVCSDFRSCWELGYSARAGCTLGVHELSDLPLYHAALGAVAAASRRGSCYLASEADIQYNAFRDGALVLHREFMSCAVTQAAIDALVRPFGLRHGSLIYPLHMPQVQALLLRRYRQLADLQFSCWKASPGEQACSGCGKCLEIALVTLAEDVSPRRVGIDPIKVLCSYRDWQLDAALRKRDPGLHQRRSPLHHTVRALQRRSTEEVASILAGEPDHRRREAIAVYDRMRSEALEQAPPPEPGYVTDFLELVQAGLRRPLEAILAEHFEPTDEAEFAAMANRAQALADWITGPLDPHRSRRLLRRRPPAWP